MSDVNTIDLDAASEGLAEVVQRIVYVGPTYDEAADRTIEILREALANFQIGRER